MGMSSQPSRNKRGMLSEINVTPFVDVMLVLLIIFMVTAPLMQQGIEIELPETANSGVEATDKPFVLTIKSNKKVYTLSSLVLPEVTALEPVSVPLPHS